MKRLNSSMEFAQLWTVELDGAVCICAALIAILVYAELYANTEVAEKVRLL